MLCASVYKLKSSRTSKHANGAFRSHTEIAVIRAERYPVDDALSLEADLPQPQRVRTIVAGISSYPYEFIQGCFRIVLVLKAVALFVLLGQIRRRLKTHIVRRIDCVSRV